MGRECAEQRIKIAFRATTFRPMAVMLMIFAVVYLHTCALQATELRRRCMQDSCRLFDKFAVVIV